MSLVIVTARERTQYWQGNAPSAAAIDAAFASLQAPAGLRVLSRPRIVRHQFVLDSVPRDQAGLWTYATAPVEVTITDATALRRALTTLLNRLDAALRETATGWEPATVAPYTVAVHGDPSWWTSGAAQRTTSRDAQENLISSDLAATNRVSPVGPGPLDNRPSAGERLEDVAEGARQALEDVGRGLVPLGAVALGALALFLAAQGGRSNPARPPARRNPRGTPALWYLAQPGTSYPCRSRAVGRVVPGRGGGRVAACATPAASGPEWIAREKGRGVKDPRPRGPSRYHITRPEGGELRTDRRAYLSRAVVNRRLRDAERGRELVPATEEMWLAQGYREFGRTGLPVPLGLPYPHARGTSACDPEHPTWARYAGALEDAEQDAREDADPGTREFTQEVVKGLRRKFPTDFARWTATTAKCRDQYETRASLQRAQAVTKSSQTRALKRRLAEMDPTQDEREIFGDYVSEIIEAERDSRSKRRRK